MISKDDGDGADGYLPASGGRAAGSDAGSKKIRGGSQMSRVIGTVRVMSRSGVLLREKFTMGRAREVERADAGWKPRVDCDAGLNDSSSYPRAGTIRLFYICNSISSSSSIHNLITYPVQSHIQRRN